MLGNRAMIDDVGTYAIDACAAFIRNLPGGSAVDTKWFRFAVTQVLDPNGKPGVLNYRWKRLSTNSPQLSQGVCEEAYKQLSTAFCTGRDGKKYTTQGGTLQVAGDDGYEVGIDPDTMDEYQSDDPKYSNVEGPLDISSPVPRV